MQRRNSDKRKRRRGAVAVMVMVMLPVLVGFAAMTFDVGTLYNTKGDMQGVADSAALASVTVLAYADAGVNAVPQAIEAAMHATSDNLVMGRTLSLEAETDIVLGQSVYDAFANSYVFTPGATPTNAVRVTVRHTADSPNGPAPLYFASIFGSAGANLTSSAVAMFVSTDYQEVDCNDTAPGKTVMCHWGDRDDSDDSQGIYGPPDSDDSDDSDTGDSDDSDDSASGDSVDSDDSQGEFDSDSDSDRHDSESSDGTDSDGPFTILVDTVSLPYFLQRGDELGPCPCVPGDSDDSDDSQGEFGPPDSDDSDDSDSGDSDGSSNGDSDDSDDSQGEFGPPDSDDSDDSDSGDSDGSHDGDSDDSDDSQGEFGPPDSDDSDDSDDFDGDSDDSDDSQGEFGPPDSDDSDDSHASDSDLVEPGQVTVCHYPPGNPANMFTLSVGAPALSAHLAHGDIQGPCATDAKLLIFLVE